MEGISIIKAWSDYGRESDTARLIADNPISITVVREGTSLSAQTVRVETSVSGAQQIGAGANVRTGVASATLLGYRGHGSIADTDVKRGDRFLYGGLRYEVVQVVLAADRLLAYAEAVS